MGADGGLDMTSDLSCTLISGYMIQVIHSYSLDRSHTHAPHMSHARRDIALMKQARPGQRSLLFESNAQAGA